MSLAATTLDLAPRRRRPPGRIGWSATFGFLAVTLLALPVALAIGVGAALSPVLALGGLVALALVAVVVWRPEFAAYILIAATPLIVGIDRDRIFPMLRPNEALLGLLIAILAARAALQLRVDTRPRISMGPVAIALLGMALAGSVLPIVFMVVRGREVEMDDLTHAAVMWKNLAIFALVRYTVRTQAQVRVCIRVSMSVAVVVGSIAILQSLGLFGVRELLVPWYASFGYTDVVTDPRAGSTIGLPAATADFMILNLALAIGLWWKDRRAALLILPAALVYMMATFAAAEFSSALGLMVAMVTVAALLGRLDLLRYGVLGLPVAIVALWPTVEHRIVEFQSMHGIPRSWLVRWYNLETYFWPELFSGTNPIFGVRPSARVPANEAFGFVWIESGYTWLLWGGGVFLAGAFGYFVWVALRTMRARCRELSSYSSVAALAAYAGVVVVVVLMVFDPHITYRGFADALYGVLALALVQRSLTASRGAAADVEQEARS
jgi:hypothetical protein